MAADEQNKDGPAAVQASPESQSATPSSPTTARPVIELLPYQKAALNCDARFTWNCWSRQTGKSFTFALRRVLRGLMRGRNQIILSAGERQSREVMEKVRMHCFALKIWTQLNGQTFFEDTLFRQLEARLPGNVRIIALPANPMTARGFTGDVFLDEFAMHRDDEAIWAALFPTLLRGEGELDVASTPRGCKNMFHRLRSNERFARNTLTLDDAAEQGLDVDAEMMRSAIGDEQAWRQEFRCEFLDETTSFMTHELIRSCQDERLDVGVDWREMARPGADVYVGVDVGRHRDATAIWLWQRRGETFVSQGVEVMQAAPFGEQEAALSRILDQRGVRRCCIDATGLGLHLAERLAERFGEHRVEGVVFTAGLKSQLAGGLRVLAERGLLRIPVDETIANDWHAITRIVTGAGHLRFDADRSSGSHADRFWAAALGVHAADAMAGEAGLETGDKLTFATPGAW